MDSADSQLNSAPRGTFDIVLKLLQSLGLVLFLGGLAALASLWRFGPRPDSIEAWRLLIGASRSIFYPCVFNGIIILVLAGSSLWWRNRRRLRGQRWFRLMMAMIVIAVPASHITGRWTALELYRAIDEQRLGDAAALWNQLGTTYCVSLAVILAIAAVGIVKPGLGQTSICP